MPPVCAIAGRLQARAGCTCPQDSSSCCAWRACCYRWAEGALPAADCSVQSAQPAPSSCSLVHLRVLLLQRVAVCGAVLHCHPPCISLASHSLQRRSLVLLDEVTACVDPATSSLIHAVLLQQTGGGAAAVLHIAHDLASIAGYQRVLLMEGGRIVEEGGIEELAAQPGSKFAALAAQAHVHM